jgi:hypothetical protein
VNTPLENVNPDADDLFKGRHFDREIIILCVRWYLRSKLSFRDLVEMMAERGISLGHTTIMPWTQRYVPEFEKCWNRIACLGPRWHSPPTLRKNPSRTLRPAESGRGQSPPWFALAYPSESQAA